MTDRTLHYNWAGSQPFSANRIERPHTVEEVQHLVREHDRVRVFGARHSFNDVADTTGLHLSLASLNRILSHDVDRQTVTVEGGIRYGELGPLLHEMGYALPNMASLPHISVAGAVATATHGSGDGNRNLAAAVRSLDVIDPEGEMIHLSAQTLGDDFLGVPVSLGALGPIVSLELKVVPAFHLRQTLYEGIAFSTFLDHLDEIMGAAYSVSLFTDWIDEEANQIWLKQHEDERVQMGDSFFGATPASFPLHPIENHSVDVLTPQMGIAGPWHLRLPHFLMSGMPAQGAELQSEYFVPRRHGRAALEALRSLNHVITPLLRISEVRSVAGDSLWLSPSQGEPILAMHFTWRPDRAAVLELLPRIESFLAPFDARPHWGKLSTLSPARLKRLYPELPNFHRLLNQHDPSGKFRNAFVDLLLDG